MILEILKDGNEVLLKKAVPVDKITDSDRKLAKDMMETLLANNGVGLSANQVGSDKALLVASYGKYTFVMFNPVIIKATGGYNKDLEGCLSFPGYTDEVVRANAIQMKYQNARGEHKVKWFSGTIGRILQHEVAHLKGIRWKDETVTEIKKKREENQNAHHEEIKEHYAE